MIARLWEWILARYRLDLKAVCEMSQGRGPHDDFHDFSDDEYFRPYHFILLRCRRCKKEFYL